MSYFSMLLYLSRFCATSQQATSCVPRLNRLCGIIPLGRYVHLMVARTQSRPTQHNIVPRYDVIDKKITTVLIF